MSDLNNLKTKKKADHRLTKVHFDFSGAEVTYTSPSQGGAASGKNEAFLFKASKAEEKDLDDEQRSILKEIGEEFTPLTKSKESNEETPSSSDEGSGEDKTVNKGTDKNMSDEQMKDLQDKVVELEKALAESKAKASVDKFNFDEELGVGIYKALAKLGEEEITPIIKGMDALVEAGEAAVEKAKEDKNKEGETDLQKALGDEAGETGDAESDEGDQTTLQKALAHKNKMKEAK